MRRKFSIGSALLLLSVWAHLPFASGQAAAQSTEQEIATREIVFDAESGLLSINVGAVPIADVFRSIAEQAGAKITIYGDLGTTFPHRFERIPLERGIRRLVAGETGFGFVIGYEPAALNSRARIPATIIVFPRAGNSIVEITPNQSVGSGEDEVDASQNPRQARYDRDVLSERLAEIRDLLRSRDRDAAESLVAILAESDDPVVRRNAANALGKFGDSDTAQAALIDGLSDRDLLTRLAAFKSLAKVGGDDATMAFVRVLSEADDLQSRRAAALALGEISDHVARQALERAELDVHPTVVKAAKYALGQWQEQFGR